MIFRRNRESIRNATLFAAVAFLAVALAAYMRSLI